MSTTNALDDSFEEAERGLDWLEKRRLCRSVLRPTEPRMKLRNT